MTTIVHERYEVLGKLGQGSQGVTHLALDYETGVRVVLKELGLGEVEDWKSLELFEREGKALATLDHPNIPKYIDAFTDEDASGGQRLWLVQEYVEGKTLAAQMKEGRRYGEDEVRDMARALLEIAAYLHGLHPPMIHRDIKPENIIMEPSGQLWLVDFGAAYMPGVGDGSTMVGTSGYMPPEQTMGRAVPATDLYAIGATLAHVSSHVPPYQMEVAYMRLQFEPHVHLSESMVALLDRLLEPHVEQRCASAQEALGLLARANTPVPERALVLPERGHELPEGTSIVVHAREDGVLMDLGSRGLLSSPFKKSVVFWNLLWIVAVWWHMFFDDIFYYYPSAPVFLMIPGAYALFRWKRHASEERTLQLSGRELVLRTGKETLSVTSDRVRSVAAKARCVVVDTDRGSLEVGHGLRHQELMYLAEEIERWRFARRPGGTAPRRLGVW